MGVTRALSLAVLLLGSAGPVAGQEVDALRLLYFTECEPLALLVSVRDDDESPIGLTEDRIRSMAGSRLAAARLGPIPHDSRTSAALSMTVTVFRSAYAYVLGVAKRFPDEWSGMSNLYLPGSQYPIMGFHGGGARGASFIMQDLSERVDAIIFLYLRVNEGYCQ